LPKKKKKKEQMAKLGAPSVRRVGVLKVNIHFFTFQASGFGHNKGEVPHQLMAQTSSFSAASRLLQWSRQEGAVH